MKIEIIKDNQIITVFHHPKEVVSCPDQNKILIRGINAEPELEYPVKSKMLGWYTPSSGKEEIYVRIEVDTKALTNQEKTEQ